MCSHSREGVAMTADSWERLIFPKDQGSVREERLQSLHVKWKASHSAAKCQWVAKK